MGLYIFRSKYQPYIKVGHTTHDNPWHRLNGSCGVPKGFNSVRHPNSLLGLVEMIDLDLCGWWPEISIDEERSIHQAFNKATVIGEWYPEHLLGSFTTILTAGHGTSKHEGIKVPEKPVSKGETKAKANVPKRHGMKWQQKEDDQLRSRSGRDWKKKGVLEFVAEDALHRERTPTSVRQRMQKLGLIVHRNGQYHWSKSLEEDS